LWQGDKNKMKDIILIAVISLYTVTIALTIYFATDEIVKRLEKVMFEISAMETRMDSLEFFSLPVRKNGKGY
jgi:hypothetical protein